MVCLRNTLLMTANLPPLAAADDYSRPTSPRVSFQELAQVWAIAHSLLLDDVCGTTYHFTYVIQNLLSLEVPPAAFRAPYTFAFTLREYITAVHFGTHLGTGRDYGSSRSIADFILCNRLMFIDIAGRCATYSLSSENVRYLLLRIRFFKPRSEECTINVYDAISYELLSYVVSYCDDRFRSHRRSQRERRRWRN